MNRAHGRHYTHAWRFLLNEQSFKKLDFRATNGDEEHLFSRHKYQDYERQCDVFMLVNTQIQGRSASGACDGSPQNWYRSWNSLLAPRQRESQKSSYMSTLTSDVLIRIKRTRLTWMWRRTLFYLQRLSNMAANSGASKEGETLKTFNKMEVKLQCVQRAWWNNILAREL